MSKIVTSIMCLLLIYLNIYDSYTTYILLNNGHVEANIFMLSVFNVTGVLPGLIIVKGALITLLVSCIIVYIKKPYLNLRERTIVPVTLMVANIYYVCMMYFFNYKYMCALMR